MTVKKKQEYLWPTALEPCCMRAMAIQILCLKKMSKSKMMRNMVERMMVRASQVSLSWRMSSKKYGVQLTCRYVVNHGDEDVADPELPGEYSCQPLDL